MKNFRVSGEIGRHTIVNNVDNIIEAIEIAKKRGIVDIKEIVKIN